MNKPLYLLVSILRWRYVIAASPRTRQQLNFSQIRLRFLLPFKGAERRYVSLAMLTISLLSILSVLVASARLESLGLSPGLSSIVISATSLGSIPAAMIAGRFTARLSAIRLVLVWPLIGALVFLVGLHISMDLLLTLALAAGFDACACWVFVVAGTARTQGENGLDLVRIAAIISVFGAVVSALAGIMLLGITDPFGRVVVLIICLLFIVACAVSAHPLTSLKP